MARSYHQILNLKEKHVDSPVLKSLVCGLSELLELSEKTNSIESENKDENRIPADYVNKLREKLLTLFGRLTSQVRLKFKIYNLKSNGYLAFILFPDFK